MNWTYRIVDRIAPSGATGWRRYIPGVLLLAWGVAVNLIFEAFGWV